MTTPLSAELNIEATVIEVCRGDSGPSVMLDWRDALGKAVVVASAPWSRAGVAAALASAEPGDQLILTGLAVQAPRSIYLPGETVTLDVQRVTTAKRHHHIWSQLKSS